MSQSQEDRPEAPAAPAEAPDKPKRCCRARTCFRWAGRAVLALLILAILAMGFGMPPADAVKMRLFSDAVDRWQHNPDFRKVQVEYVELGSEAMRTRTAFVDTTTGIMALRSLPFLPKEFAVNESSLRHYTNFSAGPLTAYLHLTTEQGVADTLKMLKELGGTAHPTDEQIVGFLKQFKMDWPVAIDAGSIQSVRALVRDIDPGRGFEFMDNLRVFFDRHLTQVYTARRPEDLAWSVGQMMKAVDPYWARAVQKSAETIGRPAVTALAHPAGPVETAEALKALYADGNQRDIYVVGGYLSMLMKPEVAKVAKEMGCPTEFFAMTPAQQKAVWAKLDDRIRDTNYELWRVKQVNDWLNGLWAQVYGSVYASVIGPTLWVRDVCQIVGPLAVLAWAGLHLLRKRGEPAKAEEGAITGQLALEGGKADADA